MLQKSSDMSRIADDTWKTVPFPEKLERTIVVTSVSHSFSVLGGDGHANAPCNNLSAIAASSSAQHGTDDARKATAAAARNATRLTKRFPPRLVVNVGKSVSAVPFLFGPTPRCQ